MSETRLSAERLAEIREVAGSFGAIADLLDELDAVTRERDDYKLRWQELATMLNAMRSLK